jgi:SNF2 family DNA or RNA helicase
MTEVLILRAHCFYLSFQVLMERFNNDRKIFCFILSTRSGGVGVNLTGADTVIFYDSDWNPTMDAQAQDRCHRIGQTRDVHIYRLISEKTIEENILKKAHQKRLLGEIAIEGGNFTTTVLREVRIVQGMSLGRGGGGRVEVTSLGYWGKLRLRVVSLLALF